MVLRKKSENRGIGQDGRSNVAWLYPNISQQCPSRPPSGVSVLSETSGCDDSRSTTWAATARDGGEGREVLKLQRFSVLRN